jgi:hypothetical protein
MTVTSRASAVHRTIFEALRTATTWGAMLFIGLFAPGFGEQWEIWSWMELGGFFLLVYASLIFNNVLKFPWIEYPLVEAVEESTKSNALLNEKGIM